MDDFTTSSGKKEWIGRVLLDLREGAASAEEVEKLRALLACDREARLFYLRCNQLDFLLANGEEGAEAASQPQPARFKFNRSHLFSGLVGAGIAAAVVAIAWLLPQRNTEEPEVVSLPDPTVANLTAEYQAVFGDGEKNITGDLRKGKVALDQGFAEISFRHGARIVLQGRCGFEIIDDMTVVLNHGKLWAECPEEAHGFRILAPGDLEIIDLGTEFGVEVSESGETSLHVFAGLVEVNDKRNPAPSRFESGEAMSWTPDGIEARAGNADSSKFVSATQLARLRLQRYREEMDRREDLVLHYDFNELKGDSVPNDAPDALPGADAIKVGTVQVGGRHEDSHGLLFEKPGDSLVIDLRWPESRQSFTLAMWVNPDRTQYQRVNLISSDDWQPGNIHFQMTREGALHCGIHGVASYATPEAVVKPGTWQLLAVAWDIESSTARFYCNGRALSATRISKQAPPSVVDVRFGPCRIGSWRDYTAKPKWIDRRNFRGRIDEVMFFDNALSDKEIARLYDSGKP